MINVPTITLEQHQEIVGSLQQKISYLQEQLEWFQRQIFGQRSEKFIADLDQKQMTMELLDTVPSSTLPKQIVAEHERRKRVPTGEDAISLPPDLPVERQILDLPEEEKICKASGKPLVQIGEEVTRKLAHRPGSFYVKEIIRPKYALPTLESGIAIASLPEGLLDRCLADESFLANLLTQKYADHLPLYRISEILGRENISISRQILCQWVLRCGSALKPLYEELIKKILESGNVFADETPVKMLDPGRGSTLQGYMWVLVGGKEANPGYRAYSFSTGRHHSYAAALLFEYRGVLHSDKYGGYEKLANEKQFTWCPCWAHIRRKFIEAESGDPAFRQWVLRKIRYLFMLEKVAWARSEEERLRIRQDNEAPIIDELIVKIQDRLVRGQILPKSKLYDALGYFCRLIPHLKNYTQHPFAHLDNNVAERAIRPLALGRKNWLFLGSEKGGDAAGVILSLVQTCRACGINPREYLEDVMRRLQAHSNQKLYELLPDNWAKARS
jgi:transposase